MLNAESPPASKGTRRKFERLKTMTEETPETSSEVPAVETTETQPATKPVKKAVKKMTKKTPAAVATKATPKKTAPKGTKAVPAANGVKKAAAKKAAPTGEKKERKPRTPIRADGLSQGQYDILKLLKKRPMGRVELKDIIGRGDEYPVGKLAGRPNAGITEESLCGRGLLTCLKHEGDRGHTYAITKKGIAHLEKNPK